MKKKECQSIKKCDQELLQLSSQALDKLQNTNQQHRYMTVTGWEEGKSICVKLKDVTQAGSSRRKQSHTPPSILYDCAHPRTHGLPPAFKLSPLAPNTRSRAPGSMEVSQAMGFSSAGTGSSLLCLTGLGCSLPPPQPQGPQGREWAVSSMVTPRSRVSTLLLEISK